MRKALAATFIVWAFALAAAAGAASAGGFDKANIESGKSPDLIDKGAKEIEGGKAFDRVHDARKPERQYIKDSDSAPNSPPPR